MERRNRSRTIAFKLTMAFVTLAVFQSVLLAAIMTAGGVLKEARLNQYRIFSEKVNGRKNELENQMKNVWTNLDQDAAGIEKTLENMELEGAPRDEILEELSIGLEDMLRRTQTTGVFVAFPDDADGDGALEAIYLRNNNPGSKSRDNKNLYMLVGPWNVAEKMEIATMANWSYRLELTEENADFIRKPYEAAREIGRSDWLGYWSKPFRVNAGDEEVVAYSIPVFSSDGDVLAILGVELSVRYLYEFLPASDLQTVNSYGYILGTKTDGEGIRSTVTYGAMQSRILETDSILDLTPDPEKDSIYRLKDQKGSQQLFACVTQMGMYYHNTPFEREEWYLIGLMRGKELLQFPQKIERILQYSVLVSTLLSLLAAVVLSQWFTRNSRLMELAGLPVGVAETQEHSERVFMTGGVPLLLNLTREQEKSFCSDKSRFLAYIEMLRREKEEEKDIFKLESGGSMRWIRMTEKNGSTSRRFVFEDVTEEMLRTKTLLSERDQDGLTGVGNRMAFRKAMEEKNKTLPEEGTIGIVMCDLNNLKMVNDVFGHRSGDEYIRTAAGMLQECFPEGQVFRIGGDEFTVLFEALTCGQVERRMERIQKSMEEFRMERDYDAAMAMGYAFYKPGEEKQLESTFARADEAMYRNKKEMKNT